MIALIYGVSNPNPKIACRTWRSIFLDGNHQQLETFNGEDYMKIEVIQSLQWLTQGNLVTVYAYVIMPNHLHLI